MNDAAAATDTVYAERDGQIASVVLNRPEKLNALNKAMWLRLGTLIGELSDDRDLRCIVVRGAGGKAFAAGADISEFEAERSTPERGHAYGQATVSAMRALADCIHPTVALIQGACVGGGLELVMKCDMRICGESSRFGIPSNRLGLVISHAEIEALLAVAGRAAALEILLEARIFGAEEAREKGLVNRVVADDQVEAEAYATARRIAAGAPLTNRWHKKFLRRLDDPSPLTSAERDEIFDCYGTEDFQIGWQAFLDKVKPGFKGR
jgi:enoyl-CoA hydratase/carnithine racemase